MTVYDFIDLCVEPSFLKLTIYDANTGDDVFTGAADELPMEYEDLTVESFDVPTDGHITLNVWIDEE